jgi:hypothetical protein
MGYRLLGILCTMGLIVLMFVASLREVYDVAVLSPSDMAVLAGILICAFGSGACLAKSRGHSVWWGALTLIGISLLLLATFVVVRS